MSSMINTEPTIITIKSNGKTVTAELPWDVTLNDGLEDE